MADAVLAHPDRFINRHLGPGPDDISHMLAALGRPSLEALVADIVPAAIRTELEASSLPAAGHESQVLAALAERAGKNRVFRSYLGGGLQAAIMPAVLQRNVLENPQWYTPYTPYQAEISQGRLECLLHFQTLISELTGLPKANASLLDEATAVAEAASLAAARTGRNAILALDGLHARSLAVLETRCVAAGLELRRATEIASVANDVAAVIVQTPDTEGRVRRVDDLAMAAHGAGALLVVATDPFAGVLLASVGSQGADVAVGSAQRFGLPLGFGGPHAAFMAVTEDLVRLLPGRLVGVSKDSAGKTGYRLSLQTREQHIRREKATSNICTAQALLANLAALYACWHGPVGLTAIGERCHLAARLLAEAVRRSGGGIRHDCFLDTVVCDGLDTLVVRGRAELRGINLAYLADGGIRIALDETVGDAELRDLITAVTGRETLDLAALATAAAPALPTAWRRCGAFLTQAPFQTFHSETAMMRHIHGLAAKDLALTDGMIPLGSCTMKLNSAIEMLSLTLPGFAQLHPDAPSEQTEGYRQLLNELERWLCVCTGFAACSLQPNAGSQGEYAGLLAIRAWHARRGEAARDICLIPTSAHGTNPASAAMVGLQVVKVACTAAGDVDLADLAKQIAAHTGRVAALMITYPSTHGVFEEGVREACRLVHEAGGQVYLDGANMNAQVGLTSPGFIGADVCHLNLHKTFCIPHGGGGPGVGPCLVAAHLAPFLPGRGSVGPVSQAQYGSASICTIPWAYIAAMGAEGLTRATIIALLSANYVAHRLADHYPVLYRGRNGLVAHECILDLRPLKAVSGIEVEDIAKRLMDYGFHAPTVSFPVAGTLMVEPTESEPLEELDRFCAAMIAIRDEIRAIERGDLPRDNNPLKGAPHTADAVLAADWARPYSREQAAFPLPWVRERKYWPPVGRIDATWGDRNLFCSCS
jgi:glycine dehydrogenase